MPQSAFIVTVQTEAADPIGLQYVADDMQAILETAFDVIDVKAWAHPSMQPQPVVPPLSAPQT